MNVIIQEIVNKLAAQEPIDGWPPEASVCPLLSFSDWPDIPPHEIERLSQSLSQLDEPADQLRLLGVCYQNGKYTLIHHFLKDNPDQLGYKGKLLLVLAYLQTFRDQPDKLEGWANSLVKELVASEPSEFANLYEWFQNFIQERPMPPAFYGPQGARREDND